MVDAYGKNLRIRFKQAANDRMVRAMPLTELEG